jgi:hypothetical protein
LESLLSNYVDLNPVSFLLNIKRRGANRTESALQVTELASVPCLGLIRLQG